GVLIAHCAAEGPAVPRTTVGTEGEDLRSIVGQCLDNLIEGLPPGVRDGGTDLAELGGLKSDLEAPVGIGHDAAGDGTTECHSSAACDFVGNLAPDGELAIGAPVGEPDAYRRCLAGEDVVVAWGAESGTIADACREG